MNRYIRVRVKTKKKYDVILKLNKINVDIKSINYEKDYISFLILDKDLGRVHKYLISYRVEVIDEEGIYKLKSAIFKNRLFIVSIIFGILLFLVLSNVVVRVEVVHDDKEIRDMLYEALKDRGVEKFTFKKSYQEYENIIEEIKSKYKDEIEWLEIDVQGMVIYVRVEERIINNFEKEDGFCHIVASKSGIVKSIATKKGEAIARINDFVNKDEVLISGEIKYNEEVKANVCASGSVYAEVWYNASVSMPLKVTEKKRTGKMRFNFMIKTKNKEMIVLKRRVNNAEVENKLLFKIFGIEFYLQKEYETNETTRNLSEKEGLNEAKKLIYEKLNIKGLENSEIIYEKYLQKNINNGKLDIDMFIAIKEQIGIKKNYIVEETESDTNDAKHNGDNIGVN